MLGLFLWSPHYLMLNYDTGEVGKSPLLSIPGVPKPVTTLRNSCFPFVVDYAARGKSGSGGTVHKLEASKLQRKSNKLCQSEEHGLRLQVSEWFLSFAFEPLFSWL